MTLATDELERRIAALRAARDSGVLMVRHGDTSTQFRSMREIDTLLSSMVRELDSVAGGRPRPRLRYIRQNSKGY